MTTRLSQLEIAKRMGVHQPQVSDWLNGKRIPKGRNLSKLAAVMGLEQDLLIAMIYRKRTARQALDSTG